MATYADFEEYYFAHPERFDPEEWKGDRDARQAASALLGDTPLVALPHIEKPTPTSVSLERYQTPFKGQELRGTCYAFAACAGMEAAYQREFGVKLDLSEQYAFHINMSCELLDDYVTSMRPYENNSSYWGFRGNSSIVAKLARAAIPDRSDCPYLLEADMDRLISAIGGVDQLQTESTSPPSQTQVDRYEYDEGLIPQRARHNARYRIKTYERLPDVRPETIEAVIASGYEVVADIPGHCILLVGYDRDAREYTVKDSANPGQYQRLSYDSSIGVVAGHYITAVHPPTAFPQPDAWWLGRWALDSGGISTELVIRRTTNFRRDPPGSPTKIGTLVVDNAWHDVNGELIHDGGSLRFCVAPEPGPVPPGTMNGQEFSFSVVSSYPDEAYGLTRVNGVTQQAWLRRIPLPIAGRLSVDTRVLNQELLDSGHRTFPIMGGSCGSRVFGFTTTRYVEEFTVRATGVPMGAVVDWTIGGIPIPIGGTITTTVATHAASPIGLGSDGVVSPPPRYISVTAMATETSVTLQPESATYWIQVDAAIPGLHPVYTIVSVRGTVTEVPGLDLAEAECVTDVLWRVQRTKTPVETIPLKDPPYPSEFDPIRAVTLNHLDISQRATVLERRALVGDLATSHPSEAALIARATELRYGLPEGFLTEN